jgi:hypothetical protein
MASIDRPDTTWTFECGRPNRRLRAANVPILAAHTCSDVAKVSYG